MAQSIVTSGVADKFIGLEITINQEERELFISQSTYTRKQLKNLECLIATHPTFPPIACSHQSKANRPNEENIRP